MTGLSEGILFSTGGDQSWPVRYRLATSGETGGRTPVSGTIEFQPGTQLRTLNPDQPVYLNLSDGQWARLYLPVEDPDETRYTIEARSDLHTPLWAELHAGAPVAVVKCPVCGGQLTADKRFTFWSRDLGKPEIRVPFWSTTCGACSRRFNYSPGSGEVREI